MCNQCEKIKAEKIKEEKISRIKEHFEDILDILEIERDENSEGTPLRIAKMYVNEIFLNRNNDNIEELNEKMKVFPNTHKSNSIVKVEDISFKSCCSHHWCFFQGKASIEYIPGECLIGLSKFPRVVKYFSKKPQLQELLTHEIGEYLVNIIKPKYLKVTLIAEHTCVSCRGAENDCLTTTHFEYKKPLKDEV